MARLLALFFAWLIVVAAVYHATTSNFLRAESGWYLFLSRSAPEVQRDFARKAFTESANGHYTPFAF